MFSLVITVISIALAAALVLGSLYYGGSAWSDGSIKANATAVVNQAQQIAGAMTLYAVNNSGAEPGAASGKTYFEELVDENYLQGTPQAPKIDGTNMNAWVIDYTNSTITLPDVMNVKVCAAINKNAGDPAVDEATGILSVAIDAVPFGCVTAVSATAGAKDFVYRF